MPPIILGSLPLVSFPNNQCHGHDPCTLALGISIDLIYQVVTYICKIQWHGLRSSTPQGRQPHITLQTLLPKPSHTHTQNVTHGLCNKQATPSHSTSQPLSLEPHHQNPNHISPPPHTFPLQTVTPLQTTQTQVLHSHFN